MTVDVVGSAGSLVSELRRGDSTLVILRLGGVHRFLGYSFRLADVRGRNGFLVLLRKLAALSLSKFLEEFCGCRAYVLRCGGNEVKVLGAGCGKPCTELRDVLTAIADLISYLVTPATVTVKAMRGGKKLSEVFSAVGSGAVDSEGGALGSAPQQGSSTTSRDVVCAVCGSVSRGFLAEDARRAGNRMVDHVIREDGPLCLRDLLFRLLGRALNSPAAAGIAKLDLKVPEATAQADTAVIVFRRSAGNCFAMLKAKAYRHPEKPACGGPEGDLPALDDSVLVSLSVGCGEESVSAGYVVIGFRPSSAALRRLSDVQRAVRSKLDDRRSLSWVGEALKSVEDLYGVFADEIGKLVGCAAKSSEDRVAELAKIIEGLGPVRPGYAPNLYPNPPIGAGAGVLDYELLYVNLDGRHIVLDVESVAELSDSNTVAVIQSDGDNFGRLVNPSELSKGLRDLLPGLEAALAKALEFSPGTALGDLDPALHAWDWAVERSLSEVLRKPLLLASASPLRLLTVYIGGDENLFIAALPGATAEERLGNLLRHIEAFRDILLYAAANSISGLYRAPIGTVVDALTKARISTLSSAILLVHPKFPMYVALRVASQLVELVKDVRRDSTMVFTLDSVVYPEPSEHWLRSSITTAVPNTLPTGESPGSAVRRAFAEFSEKPEILGIFRAVYDYCLRRSPSWICLAGTADEALRALLDDVGARKLRELSEALAEELPGTVPHPFFALFNTIKNAGRGL